MGIRFCDKHGSPTSYVIYDNKEHPDGCPECKTAAERRRAAEREYQAQEREREDKQT